MTVAELLTCLFASYKLVDATKIAQEEQNSPFMDWNLNKPLVILYNSVEELVDLSATYNVPKAQAKIFSIGV